MATVNAYILVVVAVVQALVVIFRLLALCIIDIRLLVLSVLTPMHVHGLVVVVVIHGSRHLSIYLVFTTTTGVTRMKV